MDNSILVGKYIRQILCNNAELQALMSTDKIFPLIANADTTFPFIVYLRTNLTPLYTKDFLSDNDVNLTIIVVSDKYTESLDIANAVRHSLEGYRYKDNTLQIHPIKLNSITEETLEDAYIQRMSFSFSVT